MRFRGIATRIRVGHEAVVVEAASPLPVVYRGRTHGPAELHRLDIREDSGEETQR
jgi:hypothetical protein